MSDLSPFSKEFLHEQCLGWERKARMSEVRRNELQAEIERLTAENKQLHADYWTQNKCIADLHDERRGLRARVDELVRDIVNTEGWAEQGESDG